MNNFQSRLHNLTLSFSTHLNLNTFPLHASEALLAFTTYTSFMHVVAPQIARAVAPKTYRSLKPKTKTNAHLRVVSFVQSIVISWMAIRSIVLTRSMRLHSTRDDRLWAYTPIYGTVQAWAAGYFLWDVLVSAQHRAALGTSGLIHALAALVVTMLGFRPFANYYGVCFVLYELSTPFLNIHWALDKLGRTGSTAQLVNGIALVANFFGCRVVWGSYQTWQLCKDIFGSWTDHYGTAGGTGTRFVPRVMLDDGVIKNVDATTAIRAGRAFEFPATLLVVYLVANTALTTLNFYWFGLMVRAMLKRFSKGGDEDGKYAKIDTGKED